MVNGPYRTVLKGAWCDIYCGEKFFASYATNESDMAEDQVFILNWARHLRSLKEKEQKDGRTV